HEPAEAARFAELPAAATQAKRYASWQKALASHLQRAAKLELLLAPSLKVASTADEDEAAFRVRLRDSAHEHRDQELEKLRRRYAPKLKRLEERIETAQARLEREESEYSNQKMQAAISLGSTVLGALFGRKLGSATTVGRAGTTLRGASRAARQRSDVQRANEKIADLQQELEALSAEFEDEADKVRETIDAESVEIERLAIAPRKSDTTLSEVQLLWVPWQEMPSGETRPTSALL
ncbi:MAG: hypothetical protein ACREU4_07005, partial [Burkholderiales bacterium]